MGLSRLDQQCRESQKKVHLALGQSAKAPLGHFAKTLIRLLRTIADHRESGQSNARETPPSPRSTPSVIGAAGRVQNVRRLYLPSKQHRNPISALRRERVSDTADTDPSAVGVALHAAEVMVPVGGFGL